MAGELWECLSCKNEYDKVTSMHLICSLVVHPSGDKNLLICIWIDAQQIESRFGDQETKRSRFQDDCSANPLQ